MSADVKANIAKTTRNKRSGGFSYKFSKAIPSKFEVNKKRRCIFHLILVGIPSIFILSIRGGAFIGQNLLRVTKVICRQSLKSLETKNKSH